MKLDKSKRKRTIPCAKQPVKFAHTCEINAVTSLGTEAWKRRNSSGAQRVDAIRTLHKLAGDHATAAAAVAEATQKNTNQTIDSVQTRTLVRVAKKLME